MATKSKKRRKNNPILGRLLIYLGITILIAVFSLTQIEYLTPSKNQFLLKTKVESSDPIPTSVQISNNGKIPVQKGYFRNGGWQLSDETALYLISSGKPGKPGNIVIYGHNTENIFADLKKAKIGDQIQLETTSDKKLKFRVDTVKNVFPNQIEILKQGREQRITLYTCTGLLDSMRLVVSGTRV